jgi:hypothetical protein
MLALRMPISPGLSLRNHQGQKKQGKLRLRLWRCALSHGAKDRKKG